MNVTKPRPLGVGDRIALVSVSSPIAAYPRRLERGMEVLRRLGFIPVLARNALKQDAHRAGSPAERVEDIMSAFMNDDVRGVICTTGGWNANDVLPLLDYQAIRKHPKVVVGYSDITALHCALLSKAAMATFYGPTVLPELGEAGGPFGFTVSSLLRAVCEPGPIGKLPDPGEMTEEVLGWDQDDIRPRRCVPCAGPRRVTGGKTKGILLGGNLDTLITLVGTEYFPDLRGAILLLEDQGGTTAKTERDLRCLALHGVLDDICGIVYGRPCRYRVVSQQRTLYAMLEEIGRSRRIPVLADVACGHTSPMLTLPLGVRATLDADECSLSVDEAAIDPGADTRSVYAG